MATIIPFRRRKPATTSEPPSSPVTAHGIIEIRATDEGDEISVDGAYTDRLQHGAFVALRLLNMFVDKIAEKGGAGYSSSEALQTTLPKKRIGPRPGITETTDMAPLELQPRRRLR